MSTQTPDDVRPTKQPAKKPYQSPTIELYGSLGDLVGTVGNKGIADGPVGGAMDMTHT